MSQFVISEVLYSYQHNTINLMNLLEFLVGTRQIFDLFITLRTCSMQKM